MKCPDCGEEMKKGFLFCSKDGAFSFANEVPGIFQNARKTDGFVQITSIESGHRVRIEAHCCEKCRKLIVDY